MGQLPPFARNPHTSPEVSELRTSLAVILILTALLLACTSEPASPPPLPGNDAGTDSCRDDRAAAHRDTDVGNATASDRFDRYTRTDGCGDSRADPGNRTEPDRSDNADADADDRDTNAYRRAAYTHADTYLAGSPANGYGNNRQSHNGVARHGIGHPFEPPNLRPPRLEALDRRRRRLPRNAPRGPGGRKPDWTSAPTGNTA